MGSLELKLEALDPNLIWKLEYSIIAGDDRTFSVPAQLLYTLEPMGSEDHEHRITLLLQLNLSAHQILDWQDGIRLTGTNVSQISFFIERSTITEKVKSLMQSRDEGYEGICHFDNVRIVIVRGYNAEEEIISGTIKNLVFHRIYSLGKNPVVVFIPQQAKDLGLGFLLLDDPNAPTLRLSLSMDADSDCYIYLPSLAGSTHKYLPPIEEGGKE